MVVSIIIKTSNIERSAFPGLAFLCPNKSPNLEKATSFDLCDGREIICNIILAEFVGTFIFVNVILSIKYHHGAVDLVVNALTIGLALFLNVILIGGITGGSLNPAVGLV